MNSIPGTSEIAKGLPNDQNARAARCHETTEGAPDAARSADNRDLHSLEIEARRVDATPYQVLVSHHDFNGCLWRVLEEDAARRPDNSAGEHT